MRQTMGVRVCTSVRVSDSMCVCVNVTGDKCVCKSAREREGVHVTEYECAGVHMWGGRACVSGRPGPPASLPGRARRPSQGHWLRTLGRLGLGPLPTLPQSARNIYFGFWNIHSIPASNPDAEARWGHRGHEAHRGARLRAGGCVKAWRDGTCRRLGGRSCRDGGQGARSTCVMPAPGGGLRGQTARGRPPPE